MLDLKEDARFFRVTFPLNLCKFSFISGEFGSGVAAVFRFTRWAILLNTFLSLLWVGLLVVPAAIGFDYKSLDQYTFSAENIFDGKVCKF